MAVAAAIAVDPEVVVPLQVVRTHLIDQGDELVHHPLASGRPDQTNLRIERRSVVVAARRQERFLRQPRLADRGERDPFGFHPEPELHADAVRVVGQAGEPRRKTVGIGRPRSQTGIEIEVARLAGSEIPAGVHHEQLHPERRGPVDLGHHRVFVEARAVDEPGVVGDERLKRTPVADALQHELPQRAGLVAGRLRGEAEKRMRQVDRPGRGDGRADAWKRDRDTQALVGALEGRAPRARPHQPAEELIAAVVDEEEGDVLLGGAAIRSEVEPFARLEVVFGEDERLLRGAVAVGGVTAQPAEPSHVAERHGQRPGDQLGQRGAVAAGAGDSRPRLDGG